MLACPHTVPVSVRSVPEDYVPDATDAVVQVKRKVRLTAWLTCLQRNPLLRAWLNEAVTQLPGRYIKCMPCVSACDGRSSACTPVACGAEFVTSSIHRLFLACRYVCTWLLLRGVPARCGCGRLHARAAQALRACFPLLHICALNSINMRGRALGWQGGEARFCSKCGRHKPPRAHHCRLCKRCVLRMDHHCPWHAPLDARASCSCWAMKTLQVAQ